MEHRSFRTWLWTLALIGVSLDLLTKYVVFDWLYTAPENRYTVINGTFDLVAQYKQGSNGELVPYVNQGALFGLAGGYQGLANLIFAVVSFLAACMIVLWSMAKTTSRDRMLCISLGLILGGTLGNLYDRLCFGGVRDFLHWQKPDWPVFNIADCCLVLGAGLLLLQAFRAQPKTEESGASEKKLAPLNESSRQYAGMVE